MRIRDPKTTALIFASGKMVVTGAKSEDDSRLASRKYARIVQKLGFDAKFSEFKIQNIVGSCDVKFPIRLEGLAYSHGQFSSYEPEVRTPSIICTSCANVNALSQLFPGLIYRMIKPKVVLLIFVSGKIVLTGAKVTGRSLDISLLALPTLTFPPACEGAGGDIHGVQHDLHRAVRVPQAVTTASRAAPPRPHPGGSVKLRYQSIARLWTLRVPTPSFLRENGCYGSLLIQKSDFRPDTHAQSPFPLPCTYIFTLQYYKLHILGLSVLFVLVIVPPMTIAVDGEPMKYD